ncbi:uncharacterized protein ACWYII_027060 isoform 1-T1 [Salvelinus alpinus]
MMNEREAKIELCVLQNMTRQTTLLNQLHPARHKESLERDEPTPWKGHRCEETEDLEYVRPMNLSRGHPPAGTLFCCFFDFYGKNQRRQFQKSQYKEYIDFISEISTACGFNTA